LKQVQATEAKAHLAELLRAVERGESFSITRHGKTVAHLVPAVPADANARKAAVERLLALRGSWGKSGMTTEELLAARHEGHRW
jgi:prevent-host-death family protein